MTFNELNLNTPLLNALSDLGFENATTIQEKAFPAIMSGADVLGIAQTGTGKTLAYLLPVLRLWKYNTNKYPEIFIIVPTRELVVQVVEEINKTTKYMNITATGVYGGVNMKNHVYEINQNPDIVVATPGRLIDLILHGCLKLKLIKRLIIDEVDEMLNLGFRPQIMRLFDLMPVKRQNILFSATVTEDIEVIINTFFSNPLKIEAAKTGTPLKNISQNAFKVPNFNTKINLLKHMIAHNEFMSKVVVFSSTKKIADMIYHLIFAEFGDKVAVIHSNKSQNIRFETINQFQAGNIQILIATDIIARGIDISDVSCVINFDIPIVPENYIHRIGRTGRIDKKGISYAFITKKDKESINAIQELMDKKIKVSKMDEKIEISEYLIDDEIEKKVEKEVKLKIVKKADVGPAFHEKSAKNSKVNVRVRHKDKMWEKYGKKISKGQGKKKRG